MKSWVVLLACLGLANCEIGDEFVEYIEGDEGSKVILTAPHGGLRTHPNITRRLSGCLGNPTIDQLDYRGCIYQKNATCADSKHCKASTITDGYTVVILQMAAEAVKNATGFQPHIIINHLRRHLLDPNRGVAEAAQGDPLATDVHVKFHRSIDKAKAKVQKGVLFDFHGQGHGRNSTELGYLVKKSQLNAGEINPNFTSIRSLANRCGWSFDANETNLFTHPDKSFGALMESDGFKAVPSPRRPSPNEDKYFSGGHITRYHGSRFSGEIDAIQLEMPKELRFDDQLREKFARSTGRAIAQFHHLNYVQSGC